MAKISTRQCLCGLSWPLFVSRVQVGDIKNLSPHLQSGPCQRNPLRKGSPHKKQDFPENESNQFLISRALVVQFPLLLCPKESAVARFSKRIASAGHFLSPKSPAFCNNGHCRHVLSCGPALTGFVFAWEKRSAHYWQTFAVHFHRLVTLKPYFPICNQSGPCQRNP